MEGKYSSKAVANLILDLAQERSIDDISPMKIQKLVYYLHSWYLAFYKKPLILEELEAWEYGPVIPELYSEFKDYGTCNITEKATDYVFANIANEESAFNYKIVTPEVEKDDDEVRDLANEVLDVYGSYTPIQLSNLTHSQDEPWDIINRQFEHGLPKKMTIPNDLIQSVFSKKLESSDA